MQLAKKISQISMVLVLLAPLVVYSGVQFPFSIPRWTWLLACISVFFIASLVRHKTDNSWSITKVDIAYASVMIVMCFSLVVTSDIRQTLWSSSARTTGLALYLIFFAWFIGIRLQDFSKETWRNYLIFSVVVAGIASGWGLFDMFVLKDAGMAAGEGRLSVPAGNALILATYLAPYIFIAIFLLMQRASLGIRRKYQILIGISTFSIALGTIYTLSRSSYLGILVGLIIGLVGYGITVRHKNNPKSLRVVWVWALILFVGAASFYAYAVSTNLGGGRLKITADSFATMKTRVINWKIAFKSVQERPVFGVGWENYRSAVDRLFDPSLSKHSYYETRIDKPHNVLLEVWATLGTVGLIAYLFLIYTVMRASWRLYKQQKISLAGFWALVGFVSAYHVQNLFSFDTQQTILTQTLVLAFISSNDDAFRQITIKNSPHVHTAGIIFSAFVCVGVFVYAGWAPMRTMWHINRGLVASQNHDFETVHSSFRSAIAGVQGPYFFETWRWFAESLLKNYASGSQKLSDLPEHQRKQWESDVLVIAQLTEKYGTTYRDSFEWQTFAGKVSYFLALATNDRTYLAHAKKYFLRAFEISHVRQEPPILLSYVFALDGDNAHAIQWYTTAIALSPTTETATALDWLVNRFANEKDVMSAIAVLENTVNRAPSASDYARLAAAYASASRYEDAKNAVQKAVELDATFTEEAQKFISGFPKK